MNQNINYPSRDINEEPGMPFSYSIGRQSLAVYTICQFPGYVYTKFPQRYKAIKSMTMKFPVL